MRRPMLKMSLVGALLSLGVFAADDSRTKDMNKGKADASFVEEAANIIQAEIRMSQLAVSQSTNASVKELAQQMIDDHGKNFDALKEVTEKKGIMLPYESVGSSGTGTTGGTGSTLPGTTEPSTGSTTGSMGMGTDTTGSTGMGTDTTGSTTGTGSGSVGSGTVAETPPSMGTDPSAGTIAKDTADTAGATAAKYSGQLPKAMQKKYDDLAKLSGDRFDRAYLSNLIDDHKKAIRVFEKESRNGKDSELKTWASSTLPSLRSHLDSAQSVEKEVKGRRTGSM